MIPRLKDLIQNYQEARSDLETHLKKSITQAEKIVERVYTSNDPELIESFDRYLSNLEIKLNPEIKKPVPDKKATIPQTAAYIHKQEKAASYQPPTKRTIQNYLRNAINQGQLEAEKLSPRKTLVSLPEAQALWEKWYDEPETLKDEQTPFQLYATLREQGLTPEEIKTNYRKQLVPHGKNPGKFFGGLEGAYQRFRA